MKIKKVTENKKQYLDLLLLADEQENMIDKYINEGEMYVLEVAGKVVSSAVVTVVDDVTCELKSLATLPQHQKKGYASHLVKYLFEVYQEKHVFMLVGTGDSPLIVPYYEQLGFVYSHRVKDFFTDNYKEPIYEAGVLLKDMVYLKKELRQ